MDLFLPDISMLNMLDDKKNRKAAKTTSTDMQNFQVKISAKGQNQALLLGFMNFRQFS